MCFACGADFESACVQDALTIVFPKHKGDKDGKEGMVRHVYANPKDPAIDPILAMGVCMFACFGARSTGEGHSDLLFGAEESERRFNKWLLATVADAEGDLAEHSTARHWQPQLS